MSAESCFLAWTAAEPDLEFPTLDALARHLVGLRADPKIDMSFGPVIVARETLPNGAAVAVKHRDGSNRGHGALIGYAFIPGPEHDAHGRLCGAVVRAEAARHADALERRAA